MKTELLAKLVEVTSVSATEKTRLKKPIDLPRPWDGKRGDGTKGMRVLQTTQTRTKVLTSGPVSTPPVRTKTPAMADA